MIEYKNMSIELLEKNNKTFKIRVTNCTLQRSISIRNILYSSIKTYAPYLVVFHANDNNFSIKCSEIAHRVGLFIVQNSLLDKKMKQGEYFKCKINYTAKEDYEDVRSDLIELLDQNDNPTGIYPFYEGFLINQLMKNQTIHFDIYLNKDTSERHLKYRPGNMIKFKDMENDTYEMEIESFGILDIEIFYNKFIKYNKKLV